MTSFAAPLPYSAELEHPEADEAETAAAIGETMRGIRELTFKDSGHRLRSVHAKSHGLVEAELRVLPGLPPELAQGLFAVPATYKAIMRWSTTPGDMLDDHVSAPRGLALKVQGVPGERLPGTAGSDQDIVMVNGPAFSAPNGKAFLRSLKLVAATTDKAEGAKKVISAVLRSTEALIEAFGGKSATLLALGGQPLTHVLGDTFFSQTPFRYGGYVAKFAVLPVSENIRSQAQQPLDLDGDPDGLRRDITATLANGGEWELRVQLRRDADAMPVEDSTVEWDEAISPFEPVARIVAPPQQAWSAERSARIDDGMAFSPWNGLAEHRPLGSINRMRRTVYAESAGFRTEAA